VRKNWKLVSILYAYTVYERQLENHSFLFYRCVDPVLTIAATLSYRDPFLTPVKKRAEADKVCTHLMSSPLGFVIRNCLLKLASDHDTR